jgi:hypothetical protein
VVDPAFRYLSAYCRWRMHSLGSLEAAAEMVSVLWHFLGSLRRTQLVESYFSQDALPDPPREASWIHSADCHWIPAANNNCS